MEVTTPDTGLFIWIFASSVIILAAGIVAGILIYRFVRKK